MDKELMNKKYQEGRGFPFWLQFVSFCLCGQLCWNVENQWFNTFMYTKITKDVSYVTAMVIVSATLTCISTFLFGTISDRKGTRRKFIGIGYILWGISTILVGLMEFVATEAKAVVLAATMVVVLDGIMSFIGSLGYDAGFNSWANDFTNDRNKGKVGFVLGVMPIIATIVGTVVGGQIIGNELGNEHYQALFLSIGGFVSLLGVLALIFLKDNKDLKPYSSGKFKDQLLVPFKFKELKKVPNIKEILIACIIATVYFISFNFYFVHIGNWAKFSLGITEGNFGIIEGLAMILGIIVSLPLSKLIDKNHIPILLLIAVALTVIGLFGISTFIKGPSNVNPDQVFSVKNIPIILFCFFFGAGFILVTEAAMIWVRGLFPDKSRGQFEGIRCLFFTWVPMLIGTIAGDFIIKATAIGTDVDANGMAVYIPNSNLFLWAGIFTFLTFVPLFFGARIYYRRIKEEKMAKAAEAKEE